MICNYFSFLLLYIICILCYYHVETSDSLKFLLKTSTSIIKCSAHQYLLVTDWPKFIASNISCLNQAEIFKDGFPDIYNWDASTIDCNDNNKTFTIRIDAADLPLTSFKKNEKLVAERHALFHGTIRVGNNTSSSKAEKTTNSSVLSVSYGPLTWRSDHEHLYILTFEAQPIVCHIILNLTAMIHNETCTHLNGIENMYCYFEPLSKSPVTVISWKQMDLTIADPNTPPPNWRDKGGFSFDLLPANIVTTPVVMTMPPTSISKSTRIMAITSGQTMETTVTLQKTSSTSIKSPAILKPTKNKFTIVKIPLTKPKLPTVVSKKKSSSNERSSSPSNIFILLLILIILCIIGSISFFMFRSQRNQQHVDKSNVNIENGDDSYNSDINESEIEPPTESEIPLDIESEQNEIRHSRKSARVVNQLDPDLM